VHLCLYPFLSAASKYVEESGITLDNLIHTGTFRYARSRGKERIIEAIKDGKVRKPVIISNTLNLRDKRWKLVNRGLERGEVKLRKSEFVRIIQEAIYERIKKDLPLDVPVVICEAISVPSQYQYYVM